MANTLAPGASAARLEGSSPSLPTFAYAQIISSSVLDRIEAAIRAKLKR